MLVPNSFRTTNTFMMNWTTFVVGPPMFIEMATTVWFLLEPPLNIPNSYFGLVQPYNCLGQHSTVPSPFHNSLLSVFDINAHKNLVLSNWIRTDFGPFEEGLFLYITFSSLKQVLIFYQPQESQIMTPDIRIFQKNKPTCPREWRLRTVLDDSQSST